MCLSVPQTAVAATRIRTSSGPGFGSGHSRISVPAGPSTGAVLTTASIGFADVRDASASPSEAPGSYHSARELRPPPQLPPDPAEPGVDEVIHRRRRLGHVVLVSRQLEGELV